MKEEHYSTFALDLHWATRDPEIEAHVAGCERCGAYVAHLRELDGKPLAVPARRRRAWRWPALAAFVAAAAVVAFVLWHRPAPTQTHIPRGTYVAAKSAPALQVLLQRDGQLHVWEGGQRIRGNDKLALRVACEAMTHVTVLVRDRQQWTQTFAGTCTDEVLPFTLVVDSEPGEERIAVVLSAGAIDQDAAARAADQQTRTATVWALQSIFTKEARP